MRMESNKNNNAPKKKNKFNIYWIYGIFILVILAVQIFGYGMGSNQEIDYKKFIQLAEDNSIEKLVVVNQAEARVYIKKSELSRDRKSTRLNSSHVAISYAVFCLKKK